jgi:hypothetical protein
LFEFGSSLQLLTKTLDFPLTVNFSLTVQFMETLKLSLMLLFSLTLHVSHTLQLSPHVVITNLTVNIYRFSVNKPPLSPLPLAVSHFFSLTENLFLSLLLSKLLCTLAFLLSKLLCMLAFLLLLLLYLFLKTSPIGHD